MLIPLTFAPRRLRFVIPLLGIGMLVGSVAGPSAGASPVTERPSATAPVTWSGWRGVTFGSTLASAHRRLGGTLHHTATTGGCGDVLTTRTGVLDGNNYARPHRVGNISVARTVHYPLGVRVSMTPARVVRLVRKSSYPLHRVSHHDYGSTQHENWVRGPHGHTLYFAYTDGRIYRMGLAVSQRVARGEMEMNGC